MIDPSDKKLSIRKQAKLLGINRNRLTTRQTKSKRSTEHLLQFCQRSGSSGSYAMRLSMV